MKLNEHNAKQIVDRAMKVIPYSVNVMDEMGRIIGSGDKTRIHQKHEGAILAITESRTVEINNETAKQLKGVRAGINLPILYLNQIIGVIGISGEPDDVRRFGELVKMTAELIVEQSELMAQIEWGKRHREELVLQLVRGTKLNDNQLSAIAERLNINLSVPRVAVLVKVIPQQENTFSLEHLQQMVNLLEYPERDNLVGILSVSNNEIVILKPIVFSKDGWSKMTEEKCINKLLKRIGRHEKFTIKMSLGDYFSDRNGIEKSFETAKLTMNIAEKKEGCVFFYQDYKFTVLASSIFNEPWKMKQINKPLSLLKNEDKKNILIPTLKEYFDQNCDACLTCKKLKIHRNTLRYRLEQIETITGLNFNKLDNLLHLYFALNIVV
ncbi:sugar diacid recognition domain-containing protein [Vibrio harveyi]|uniref:sugar diacid recognition domain-containing protein n=1 Tax=Vibrio harveyi TaxID=669 RepID=UPI003D70EAA0